MYRICDSMLLFIRDWADTLYVSEGALIPIRIQPPVQLVPFYKGGVAGGYAILGKLGLS